MAPTLLIVDDHPAFRRAARRTLSAGGFDVIGEADGVASARDILATVRPGVVLLDVNLGDGNGFEVAEWLRTQDDPPVIVMTSDGEREDLEAPALKSGALAFTEKAALTAAALTAVLTRK